jgi:hypothetical protein
MKGFTYPIPEILTKQNWDKKKGIIAKLAGPTGIGDKLEELRKAYAKVDWKKVNAYERMGGFSHWNKDDFTRATWQKYLTEAQAQVQGPMVAVVKECEEVRDHCIKVAKTLKDKRGIPSSTTQHVLTMAKRADQMADDLGKPAMARVLNTMNQELLGDVDKIIDGVHHATKGALKRHESLFVKLRNDPTASTFNSLACPAARDIAQNIGNLDLAFTKGFGKKVNDADRIAKALSPYANTSNNNYLKGNLSPDEVVEEIDALEHIVNDARKVANSL